VVSSRYPTARLGQFGDRSDGRGAFSSNLYRMKLTVTLGMILCLVVVSNFTALRYFPQIPCSGKLAESLELQDSQQRIGRGSVILFKT
jgi:hypothetical protein